MWLHAITMQKAGLYIENNHLTSYNKHYRKLHQKRAVKCGTDCSILYSSFRLYIF